VKNSLGNIGVNPEGWVHGRGPVRFLGGVVDGRKYYYNLFCKESIDRNLKISSIIYAVNVT